MTSPLIIAPSVLGVRAFYIVFFRLLMFLITRNEQKIVIKLIRGIIKIAGTTFTSFNAMATILAVKAVMSIERKIIYVVAAK